MSIGVDGFAESPQSTEKIKIISACCINSKWTFNLYDGVSGKTVSVKQGRRNAQGYQIKSFNEKTQTAVIITPRGTFSITMNEHKPAEDVAEPEANQISEKTGTTQTKQQDSHSTKKKEIISRKQILERIK